MFHDNCVVRKILLRFIVSDSAIDFSDLFYIALDATERPEAVQPETVVTADYMTE